jgi:ABC-type antimicrobial peptide transport system permease subunit
MFVLAVGHLLLTSVRRRRQDLAVLKALGFSRRQLMATVASQAVTVAACGIIVGAAVGVTLGSALWRTTADDVGVVSNVTIPLLVLAAVAAATVALVSLVGVIPARHAANVPVAPALRAE